MLQSSDLSWSIEAASSAVLQSKQDAWKEVLALALIAMFMFIVYWGMPSEASPWKNKTPTPAFPSCLSDNDDRVFVSDHEKRENISETHLHNKEHFE